jgi:hypothetical protein
MFIYIYEVFPYVHIYIYNVYFKHQYGFRNNIWIAPIFIAEQEIPGKTAEDGKKRKEKNL